MTFICGLGRHGTSIRCCLSTMMWCGLKKFSLGRISDYELYAAQNNQFTSLSQYASAIRQAYTNYYIIRGMTLYDFKKERDLIESLIK